MKVKTKNEFDEIVSKKKVVFVDFYAAWCGPCQMMAPAIEEIEKEYKDDEDVAVIAIDIDEHPDISAEYGVMSVPTYIFLQDSEKQETIVGAVAKDIIKAKIEELKK